MSRELSLLNGGHSGGRERQDGERAPGALASSTSTIAPSLPVMEGLQKENEQLKLELAASRQANATLRAQLLAAPSPLLPGLRWRLVDARGHVVEIGSSSEGCWRLVNISTAVSPTNVELARVAYTHDPGIKLSPRVLNRDILLVVCGFCDRPTLLQLALVSSSVLPVAARGFYREVFIDDERKLRRLFFERVSSCCATNLLAQVVSLSVLRVE